MKAVILAGGRGTRLSEETHSKPKPLVDAGGHPLLWHIMQNFARFGVSEFIVLAGYKGYLIKDYFRNFWIHEADVTFDLTSPNYEILEVRGLPWKVTVLDTGIDTGTGGRINFLKGHVNGDFLLTYGDGVADVDIASLISTHKTNGKAATLTAVRPPARFGALEMIGTGITSFTEKPAGEGGLINGGYMVLPEKVFSLIANLDTSLENDILPQLAESGELGFHVHDGIFVAVDTVRDLQKLEKLIEERKFPWT